MISVIIPTYRPQAYIWECLLSLATQTLPKNLYEIIIVLNGCNEPFHSQIQQYIIDHLPAHQVQLIQTNTGGVYKKKYTINLKIQFTENKVIEKSSAYEKIVKKYNSNNYYNTNKWQNYNFFLFNQKF